MINLNNNLGFKWRQSGNYLIKGCHEEINRQYDFTHNKINDASSFIKGIEKIQGNFAIVYEDEEIIFALVDRIRSIPLFYGIKNGEFYLSDDARWVRRELDANEINNTSKIEFYLTGYVTGPDTLYSNVKQIQAGEYIVYRKKDQVFSKEHYFKFWHSDYYNKNKDELIELLDEVYLEVFKRLIHSLNGRTAVLPLSGGYDSRLIAIMLKRLGYENVVCFTYGVENNNEALVSKKVAEILGFKWIFIPYTEEDWIEWYHSDEKKEYFRYADGLSSIPHIQDIIAVRELKEKQLIPHDSIFIPGHAGDFVAGSHIPENFVTTQQVPSNKIVDQILNSHYNLWNDKRLINQYREEFSKKIFHIIEHKNFYSSDEAADVYERWDWAERQAKFIGHSIRVYEFYGFEWRLPLWEKDIIEFWQKISLENRVKRSLYFDYVNKKQTEFNEFNKQSDQNHITFIKKMIKKTPLFDFYVTYKKNKVNLNHPLAWDAIIKNNNLDKERIKKLEHINSYLTYDYLKTIDIEQE